ncbi:MAG: extracellular solute-binding protein [Anaerolineaceae bacterium]|nr:extracellular solute-binding protein [Anaerolineaceae bacterium]
MLKKKISVILAVLLIFSMILTACGADEPVVDTGAEDRIAELEAELEAAEAELVTAKDDDGVAESELEALQAELAAAEAKLEEAQAEEVLSDEIKIIPFITQETDAASIAVYQNIIKEYQAANPGIQIDLVVSSDPDTMGERMIAAAAVGADMGIVSINAAQFQEFYDADLLLPLDRVVDTIGEEKFIPGSLVYADDGSVYMMGYNGGAYGVLWVNTEMLEAAGLDIPTNYEEVLAAAEAMTIDKDGDGEIDQFGIALPGSAHAATGYVLTDILYENCAGFYDKQGNVIFDHPNTLTALEHYAALLEYAPEAASAWAWGDIINAVLAEQAAMGWYYGRLGVNAFNADPEIRDKLQPIHFFAGENYSSFQGYDYFEVYSGVQYPEETLDFLEYLMVGQPMVDFLLTVPGHLAAATYGLEDAILASENEYVQRYPDDVIFLFGEMGFGASPSVQMGAMNPDSCDMDFSLNTMPWSSVVFGADNVPGTVIHKIFMDEMTPEEAWQWGVDELKAIADEWKADNPDWTPAE